jgi:hypothetical protein
MTILHIIEIAGKVAFIYTLWMCLLGVTYILLDLFMDWYQQFKAARKNPDSKNNQGGVAK